MPVTATNLIQGPAVMYTGIFGVTEPATIATAPGAGWVDVGGTQDGVSYSDATTLAKLMVDQIAMAAGATASERVVQIKTNLAEATLANLALATNNAAPAANVLTLDNGTVTQFVKPYQAILIDGLAPGGFRRRIIARRVLSMDAVEMAYKKDGQTLIPVTFEVFWVSSSVAPVIITDATS